MLEPVPTATTTTRTTGAAATSDDAAAPGQHGMEMDLNTEEDLDVVVNLERNFHDAGYTTSLAAGASAGHRDGHALGWASGVGIASELSFYHGAAMTLLSLSSSFGGEQDNNVAAATVTAARVSTTLHTLIEKIEATALHRVGNDPRIDMEETVEEMRRLFRQAVAQAGLIIRFDRRPSRMNDLSF